jgi:hypothetical protein
VLLQTLAGLFFAWTEPLDLRLAGSPNTAPAPAAGHKRSRHGKDKGKSKRPHDFASRAHMAAFFISRPRTAGRVHPLQCAKAILIERPPEITAARPHNTRVICHFGVL